MASIIKVDKLTGKSGTDASAPITLSGDTATFDDINMSSGKSIKNAAGTALLTEAGVLGSGVMFPAGHVIKTKTFSSHFTTNYYFTMPQTTAAVVTFNSIAMSLTGVTATEGNKLLISGNFGSIWNENDRTYQSTTGFIIDGTFYGVNSAMHDSYPTSTEDLVVWPAHHFMEFTVPADFTNKTISGAGMKEGTNTTKMAARGFLTGGIRCTITAQEIQA